MKLLSIEEIQKLSRKEVLLKYKDLDQIVHQILAMSPRDIEDVLQYVLSIIPKEDEAISYEEYINFKNIEVTINDLKDYVKSLAEDTSKKAGLKIGVFDQINHYVRHRLKNTGAWDAYFELTKEGMPLYDFVVYRNEANNYTNNIIERYSVAKQALSDIKKIGFAKNKEGEKERKKWLEEREIEKSIDRKEAEAKGEVYIDPDFTEKEIAEDMDAKIVEAEKINKEKVNNINKKVISDN